MNQFLWFLVAFVFLLVFPTEGTKAEKIVFFGNPGAGKSTLLSGFLKKGDFFHSGMSDDGGGVSQKLVCKKGKDGRQYCDSPGLDDPRKRQQYALEIEEGIKRGGHFRVFFVVRLVEGRIIGSDGTTIRLILDALPDDLEFGIILNGITEQLFEKWQANPEKQVMFLKTLSETILPHKTNHVYRYPIISSWIGKDDVRPTHPRDFVDFIDEVNPRKITKEDVKKIKVDEFEMWEARLNEIIAENKRLGKALQDLIEAKKEDQKRFQEEIARIRREHPQIVVNPGGGGGKGGWGGGWGGVLDHLIGTVANQALIGTFAPPLFDAVGRLFG